MILPLFAAAFLANQTKPSSPAWWPLTQIVGHSVDEVWPALKSFSPTATKGQVSLTSGDVKFLCFSNANGVIEVMNAIHLVDHRFIRVGSEGPTATPDKPTWLNPMKFLANSPDTVGDETVHTELTLGRLVALATGSATESSVRFFIPAYLDQIDGKSFPGQMEFQQSPVGQLMYVTVPMKNGLTVGAVALSANDSLYTVTTRFLPSTLSTVVSAKRRKIDWKKWVISSLVVAPNAVFEETVPRRRDDGVFRQDLGDYGVFSFRPEANGVPIADPSMAFTSTEFTPSGWVK